MQLPSIDRSPHLRPVGAEAASAGANRVIPVAPVNPTVTPANSAVEPVPSVIDMVNPALKPQEGRDPAQGSVDPLQRGGAEAAQRDWTLQRPPKEKVEDPPPKPISQVLMDHLKTMWNASANAIQSEQVRQQLQPPVPAAPSDAPGQLAKEVLVYQPSKIKKNESV